MRNVFILLALATIASTLAIQKQETSLIQHHKIAVLDGRLCTVCKDLIQVAEIAGEGDIKAWLYQQTEKLCYNFGIFGKLCNQILDHYVVQLADLINENHDPITACIKMNLC